MNYAYWRKIIRRDTDWLETASLSGRSFSWRATYEHKLTLECGHTQRRRGHSEPPKTKVICKLCERGKPHVSVDGIEHGVFDRTLTSDPKGAAVVAAIVKGGAS